MALGTSILSQVPYYLTVGTALVCVRLPPWKAEGEGRGPWRARGRACTLREINGALVGREIEYVFSIARMMRGRSSACPYVGVIEKVRVVSAAPAHTPTTHLEDKGKGKRKGKAKQRKGKAKAAAAQLPVRLPSVWVRWTLPQDTPCWVFLVSGLYGQGTKVDGWAIRPKEAEEARSDPMELSVEEAMHLHAIKADRLCPKM